MPRPPRIDFPDALYHVTSRGNGRDVIFWSDADRERFLGQLADNLRVAGAVLYAYVLMDNHFHLLVRTPRANLSRFMQRLLTAYALYARYKHRRPGHQLQGRFKAKLVEDETYLLAVTRYIHLNPVKVAACRKLSRADRLRRLNAYRWSSYAGYADAKLAQEFVCYDVLKEYAANLLEARRQYRADTHACLLEDDAPIIEAMAASRHAIGTTGFVEKTEQTIELRREGRLQDKDIELPRRFRMKAEQLRAHGHVAGPAKAAAVELACRLSGMTQRAIGAHYGGIGAAAVSTIHRKVQRADDASRAAIGALLPRLTSMRRRKIDN
jgi:REP element-mobilizing transposase RayT